MKVLKNLGLPTQVDLTKCKVLFYEQTQLFSDQRKTSITVEDGRGLTITVTREERV